MELNQVQQFLSDLSTNNNKVWMGQNRILYQESKQEFESLVGNIIEKTKKIDENLGFISPKDCIFRINRDLRFSKDKTPYNPWFSVALSQGGKKSQNPAYFFRITPNYSLMIGGGLWEIESTKLYNIRSKIADGNTTIQNTLKNTSIKKLFGELRDNKLINIPRGFDKNNPQSELLKQKSYVLFNEINDLKNYNFNDLENEIMRYFDVISIFNKVLYNL
jgi:uncharacterized protein (TIGR02453 family)